jgi:hypothetical protein
MYYTIRIRVQACRCTATEEVWGRRERRRSFVAEVTVAILSLPAEWSHDCCCCWSEAPAWFTRAVHRIWEAVAADCEENLLYARQQVGVHGHEHAAGAPKAERRAGVLTERPPRLTQEWRFRRIGLPFSLTSLLQATSDLASPQVRVAAGVLTWSRVVAIADTERSIGNLELGFLASMLNTELRSIHVHVCYVQSLFENVRKWKKRIANPASPQVRVAAGVLTWFRVVAIADTKRRIGNLELSFLASVFATRMCLLRQSSIREC